ncbi:MAG: hypothetical protein K8S16_00060 [Bacteroidales bacterium]|nr:hypothetical protein [Bacteroidales bacterium]
MIKNVVIIFLAALILYVLWILGLEKIYAYFLYYLVYLPVAAIPETHLSISTDSGHPLYTVASVVNNKDYTWSLSGELFLLPVVLLMSWQIFLFKLLPRNKALKISRNNILILVASQLLYLFFLTLYWKSAAIRVIHDMMNNNLIIIVVFLIIKDSIRNRLFGKISQKKA